MDSQNQSRPVTDQTGRSSRKNGKRIKKSEVNTDDKNGMRIFSVHNWQKEIPVPENLDYTTLACKVEKIWVVLTAEFKKQEIPITREEKTEETEIPIEKLD